LTQSPNVIIVVTLRSGYNDSIMGGLMGTTSVGIRDAKIHLSKFLKMVQEGNEVILTDRGRPVGKIVPIQEQELPLWTRIKRLEDQGLIEHRSAKARKKIAPSISIPDNVAQRFLKEDRGDE
jgi:prevent-host-death family protein